MDSHRITNPELYDKPEKEKKKKKKVALKEVFHKLPKSKMKKNKK